MFEKSRYRPTTVKPSQILFEAARILKEGEKRWIQNAVSNGHGGVCMLGAIYTAQRRLGVYKSRGVEREDHMGPVMKIVGDDIPTFNDRPGRTKEEVIAALERGACIACKEEEKQEQPPA